MQKQMATLSIPAGVEFSDLRLTRLESGVVSFDWTPIKRICDASNVPIDLLRAGPEASVAGLIISWYVSHLKHGGAPDLVAEDWLAEIQAEGAAR